MTTQESLPSFDRFEPVTDRRLPRGIFEVTDAPEIFGYKVSLGLGATASLELGYPLAAEPLAQDAESCEEAPVPIASPTLAESLGISGAEAAALIEERGYACPARRFGEQVLDETRQNRFGYDPFFYVRNPGEKGYMTEHEGLLELQRFLRRGFFDQTANSMLRNLTFIGEKEYAEGAAGLADYWKQYLDSEPEAQLCITTLISGTYKFKSDKYLLERVLEHFTDDELERYKGRLLVEPKELSVSKDKVRVVMLDDWIVSGQQMGRAFDEALSSGLGEYADQIEINLLTASPKRIENGLQLSSRWAGWSYTIPIKAYFLAHSAEGPVLNEDNDAYVGGTHSLVDFEFAGPLRNMCSSWLRRRLPLPALVRVSGAAYEGYTGRRQYKRVANLSKVFEDWE